MRLNILEDGILLGIFMGHGGIMYTWSQVQILLVHLYHFRLVSWTWSIIPFADLLECSAVICVLLNMKASAIQGYQLLKDCRNYTFGITLNTCHSVKLCIFTLCFHIELYGLLLYLGSETRTLKQSFWEVVWDKRYYIHMCVWNYC